MLHSTRSQSSIPPTIAAQPPHHHWPPHIILPLYALINLLENYVNANTSKVSLSHPVSDAEFDTKINKRRPH
ncbi:hypothetical protein L6452_22883 [Arctium lappa]|uniref:Uncharacterized protein n=1 Tax=Arctium lappa TaxID=4217 RepID=A0ACB9B0L2_ARCLA|nr:hypothetical protein L6452_22883 [Arctium lappa]